MKAVGIDIGESSVKVAVVENIKNRNVLVGLYSHSLNLNPNADHEIEIIDYLRSLLIPMNLGSAKFCFAMDPRDITTRVLPFAFKERAKIARTIAFELEDLIPLDPEDLVIDSKILRTAPNGAEVLAMAVKTEEVAETLEKLNSYGVKPSVLSAETTSYFNLFEDFNSPPPKSSRPLNLDLDGDESEAESAQEANAIAHLHIGFSKSFLILQSNSEGDRGLLDTLTLDFGLKSLIDKASLALSVPFVEAKVEIEKKSSFSLGEGTGPRETEAQKRLSEIVSQSFEPFFRNLKLYFIDIKTKKGIHVDQIELSGGGAKVRNLTAQLTAELGCAARLVSSLPNLHSIQFPIQEDEVSESLLAIGIALNAFRRPRNPCVQFLKGAFSQKEDGVFKLVQDWKEPLVWAGAFFLVMSLHATLRSCVTESLDLNSEESLLSAVKNEPELSRRSVSTEAILRHANRLRSQVEGQKKVAQAVGVRSATELLKIISDALPPREQIKLKVSEMTIDGERVRLAGEALTLEQKNLLLRSLKSIAKNGQVLDQLKGSSRFDLKFEVSHLRNPKGSS